MIQLQSHTNNKDLSQNGWMKFMSNTHRSAVYDRIYESTILYSIPSFSYFVTRIVILILNTKIMNEYFATMIDHTGPHVATYITRNAYIFCDLSIIMTSWWARWRLKPPVYRLFIQPLFFWGGDQRKYQSSVSLPFVWGIHLSPVNFPEQRASNAKIGSIWWRYHVERIRFQCISNLK